VPEVLYAVEAEPAHFRVQQDAAGCSSSAGFPSLQRLMAKELCMTNSD
jgi:hypothetical protein